MPGLRSPAFPCTRWLRPQSWHRLSTAHVSSTGTGHWVTCLPSASTLRLTNGRWGEAPRGQALEKVLVYTSCTTGNLVSHVQYCFKKKCISQEAGSIGFVTQSLQWGHKAILLPWWCLSCYPSTLAEVNAIICKPEKSGGCIRFQPQSPPFVPWTVTETTL